MADTNYNKDEFGQLIQANMGQDVSTATELKLILQSQVSVNGDKKEKAGADGVTVGTVNVVVNDETFLANEYLQYTLKEDDLDKAGLWRVKGEALLSSTNRVIGDFRRFSVGE